MLAEFDCSTSTGAKRRPPVEDRLEGAPLAVECAVRLGGSDA